jgi:hypothetical protein
VLHRVILGSEVVEQELLGLGVTGAEFLRHSYLGHEVIGAWRNGGKGSGTGGQWG